MGMDYNPEFDPGAMDAMPRVRIAGAAVGVHPRALYFAAAAQVGMDEREGRAAGAGHYVPAGGLRTLLRDVADMASRLATERTPAAAAERRGAVRAARRSPVAARSTRCFTANCSARCTSSRTRRQARTPFPAITTTSTASPRCGPSSSAAPSASATLSRR